MKYEMKSRLYRSIACDEINWNEDDTDLLHTMKIQMKKWYRSIACDEIRNEIKMI